MALNWVQRDPQDPLRPLMLPGERIVEMLSEATVILEIPPTLAGPKQQLRSSSAMWLTNKRIVFLCAKSTRQEEGGGILGPVYSFVNSYFASPVSDEGRNTPTMDSLTIPYSSIRDITFQQGLFTPNGLGIAFTPVPDGNFPPLGRNSVIELHVSLLEGRVYDIWKRARELWEDSARGRVEEESLPKYTPS